jgi:hypothetical protein
MRFNLNNINNVVKQEKMDICVICYGGCASNTLVNILEKNGYKCKTKSWDIILCHCPEYIKLDIPIIYLYNNPIHALLSMKRRNLHIINQSKLSNKKKASIISDEILLSLMIKQFFIWTNKYNDNNKLLIIKTDELFENNIKDKLSSFLNNPNLIGFPISYKKPLTNINLLKDYQNLFIKYKTDIDTINNYKAE